MRTLLGASHGGGAVSTPYGLYNDSLTGGQGHWNIWDVLGHNASFNGTVPGHLYMESGLIVTRTGLPTPPFSMQIHCTSITYDNINTPGNATLGVGYTPTTTANGGFWGLEWDIDTPGYIGIYDGEFIPMFGDTPDHYSTIKENTAGHVNEVPHWQRMVVHSANNIDLYYTREDVPMTWTTYATGINPIVTLDCLYIVSFACTTTWRDLSFF